MLTSGIEKASIDPKDRVGRVES